MTYVKILFSSLYPSITLENNMAPNTQLGKIIIEDPDNPNKHFGTKEHPSMYTSDEEVAKYSRGGEFLDNMMSDNVLEFCERWMGLGNIYEVMSDMQEFFNINRYYGRPMNMDPKEVVYFSKDKMIQTVSFENNNYSVQPAVMFYNKPNKDSNEDLIKAVSKGAIL